MTTPPDKVLEALRASLKETERLRQRNRELASASSAPIAVVSVGCRFPGQVDGPDSMWELLAGGRDAIAALPRDRGWETGDEPGTAFAPRGGFVYDAAEFDPGFFGISPREALAMDPQQRLLLEVCWEALERAGIDPASLRGRPAGVFVGGGYTGYGEGFPGEAGGSEGYLLTGSAAAVISGRVSYTLGLEGPAVTVDTACSSSLVALHLACQALRSGECTLALAGGVTIMATSSVFAEFSRQRGLAADGRCKAFSAAADGTGWAEGAGMLVLERLADARRHGHPVLALIRGSAVNQDGASNGLTAPNGPSQQRVIRAALAAARISADQVDAVEAHGTGTVLGDPIEAQALLGAYGQDRPAGRPLWLGSVKSNIGHTQAAAGVAGVIKIVLALRHGLLPRTLHVAEPSPHIDWAAGAVRLAAEPVPWPVDDGRPRRAGVSSFGISGTNVHAILEEAPPEAVPPVTQPPVTQPPVTGDARPGGTLAWLVSARTADGLRAQARRLREFTTARDRLDPADVAWSLAATRASLEQRAVVTGASRDDLAAGLAAVMAGEPAAGVITGTADAGGPGKVAFVFPGQGGQWAGMGRDLAAASPVFAARLAECGRALAPHTGWDLARVLAAAELPGQADVVQPALWAVMVSLAAAWQDAGVTPDAVVGHSQGEIAAACVAGILSLDDAAQVVARRSQALRQLSGHGGMISVAADAGPVRDLIAPWGHRLSVAAVNGPAATVVSGDPPALAELAAACETAGIRTRMLPVDYASHSAQVGPLHDEILAALDGIAPGPARIPMISAMTGQWLDGPEAGAGYWYDSLRAPVRFADAARALAGAGYRVFAEVSPHPVLTAAITETAADAGHPGPVVTGTLRRDDGGRDRFLAALAAVHVRGARVDWPAVLGPGRRVDLPTYAFQRQRYWPQVTAAGAAASPAPTAGTAGPAAEARFWTAVDDGDVPGLATALALDERARLDEVLPALASWRRRERDRSERAGWRYQVSWVPVTEPAPPALSGTWLMVVPPGAVHQDTASGCARALAAYGAEVVTAQTAPGETGRAALAARIGQVPEVPGVPGISGIRGVVSLLGLDEDPADGLAPVPRGLAGTLGLVQALGDAQIEAPLWVLTRGAAGPGGEISPAQAMVWGLGRVAGLEHPGRWGGLVDLPARWDERAAGRLCAALAGGGEDQVAIRDTGLWARRLTRTAPRPGGGPDWRPRGTVLVTGGTGAIGPYLAGWLARQGAPRVVLASRSGPAAADAARLAAAVAEGGSPVTLGACDITERASLRALLSRLAASGPPVTTVLHAAVTIELAPLARSGPDALVTGLRAKVGGAALLDELTDEMNLDSFVLFSSIAGVWGSGLHGPYAAANAYLDALAASRRRRGQPATSVAWGVWDTGWDRHPDLLPDGVDAAGLRRQGLTFLDPRRALAALGQVLAEDETFTVLADVDWARFAPVYQAARPWRLLDEIPEVAVLAAGPAAGPRPAVRDGGLAARLAGRPAAERERVVTDLVRGSAAAVLGHPGPAAVEPDRAFRDLGFDSLTAVELRDRLNEATGLRLPSTVVFDYPSAAVLARHVLGQLLGTADAAPAVPGPAAAPGEPVAIVAMGCRYPGAAAGPEELWELLRAGRDAISDFPADRGWDLGALFDPDPDHAGTSYVRSGGFVAEAGDFDPGFFGISPREALAMDPQQRLLLEVSWEAIERAGIDPAALRGTATGVFAGASSSGYSHGLSGDGGHELTGNAASVISGRLSYTLGLEGPAVTVDTACSSSLVAVHLASQALRAGECELALAGGVAVIANPGEFVGFSRQRALAADGRCKAFGADADGMGLAEGAGVLVLERLSDARRNGHPVLAVIRGSAVNQDGASNGLTAPNGPSQQRVIRAALAAAGLSADQVDAVEGHGTGTTLGDPIEAQAVLATYGQGRDPGQPLWLGSAKSNIGHTQAAAGAAGLIKMVLALRHGLLPATLHADEPTPHVDWSAGAVRLLAEAVPWPAGERTRRAGVSAFGMSGTNAHLILEEPPAATDRDGPGAPAASAPPPMLAASPVAWLVSGRSAQALAAQAARLRTWAQARPELDLTAAAWSLATSRSSFEYRAVVTGVDREELAAGLAAVAAGEPAAGVFSGSADAAGPGRVVFVFPGQGGQWAGMGRELAASCPVFADRLAECSRALAPLVDWDLEQVLAGSPLDRVDVVQPALWAVMVSLAAAWQAAGVTPDAVVGHSQGEIAAAVVAGVLSLADAAAVVALRSRALRALTGRGGMASLAEPADAVRERIAAWDSRLSVAAVNGPEATVVSGDPAALWELAAACDAAGVRARILPVDYASHGPQVEEIRAEILAALDGITPGPARIPMISAMTGAWLEGPEAGPQYWYESLRSPVEFGRAVQVLDGAGYQVFAELSPHPVLVPAITAPVVTGTLRRDDGGPDRFLAALAEVHVHGVTVDWAAVLPRGQRTDLPTYAFRHQRYWPGPVPALPGDVSAAGLSPLSHPLLSAATELAGGDGYLLTGRLSVRSQPWLADHVVAGTVVVPGTAFVEMAVTAGDAAGCGRLGELTFHVPLTLDRDDAARVQVMVGGPDAAGRREVAVYARPEEAGVAAPWTRHASGQLTPPGPAGQDPAGELAAWPPDGAVPADTGHLYDGLAVQGYRYGPAFRGLRAAWRRGDEIFAEVALPEPAAAGAASFGLHPALLDAALHAGMLAGSPEPDAPGDFGGPGKPGRPAQLRLPFSYTGVALRASGASALRVRLTPGPRGGLSVLAADPAGTAVLSVESLVSRPVPAGQLAAAGGPGEALFTIEWVPAAVTGTAGPAPETVHAGAGGVPGAAAARAEVTRVLGLVQRWLTEDQPAGSRLAVVTRGAVSAAPGEDVTDLAGAAVWGLIRSVQSENPGRLVLADLPPGGPAADEGDLLTAALAAGEPELALRGGRVHARRLTRPAAASPPGARDGRVAGTVLVTGGTGVLGGLVAGHLAATGRARALMLTSRSGPAASGAAVLAARLAADGAAVQLTACDAADRAALAAVLARVPAGISLTGVVHAAGVLDDGVTGSLTPARVDAVMRPKADAAWHLHELTADADLDAFVLFSAAAATFGAAGQASYAAANAFLDGLAAARRAAGLPGVSLAWGLWADASAMTGHLGAAGRDRMARDGIRALTARDGLALLDLALARDEALLVPARLDLSGLGASARPVPALLRALVPRPAALTRPVAATGAGPETLRRKLARLPGAERDRVLLDLVRAHVAAVLGHASPEVIEPGRAFGEIGFDSLTAVELRNRLHDATGLRLPATLVFDYPTPAVLAGQLRSELLGSGLDEAGPAGVRRGAVAAPARAADGDPVAVVAIGCRFPGGVRDPQGFWQLLAGGWDAVSWFPEDRGWEAESPPGDDPDETYAPYTRVGGFVYDAAEFDAGFFGISPREAMAMDPQQRLLLEVSWEALERAGLDPWSLRGSPTGVFVGAYFMGYGVGVPGLGAHLMTGTASSVMSGRISYLLGLEGPAVTVDTACSSSLVALHLASQALRAGECDLALAGGAAVMAATTGFEGFARQRGLAADGRCKAFSAAADGMGLGEGAAMVVLERLSDARRNGHPVLAVVAGSAVNSDGASNGLTAPNGPSQQRVIRTALASAGLAADQVDAVEAHGTGTVLGDPIEAQALLATYGQERPAGQPLWLGSVKSNIGHTQAAAGVAGVIKMVLALQHGLLPATLYADEPSPHVDWSAGDVRLLTDPVPWPAGGRPRRAGVSSFGFSGTNAHLIIQDPPAPAGPVPAGPVPAGPVLAGALAWLVSGRTAAGLAAQAGRLAEWAGARPELDPADAAFSLATTRPSFEHRAVITGADRAELAAGLAAVAAGRPAAGVITGPPAVSGNRVVFVFPGQGGQWAGMGQDLAASSPVFAQKLAACGAALARHVDWDLAQVLAQDELPDRVDVVQPALWAVMVSLAAVWQAAGVVPDVVLGHSQGEIAAATVAGVLSLEDAAAVVALRSRALVALAGRGGMVSVAGPADAVRDRIAAWGDRLAVAAVNGPSATVVSGEPAALGELIAACRAAGVRTRTIAVDYASHSAQVEVIREQILADLAQVAPGPAEIPMMSALTGQWLDGPEAGAGYWYDSLRAPVEFGRAVQALARAGHRVFIEVSPHPVLTPAIAETETETETETQAQTGAGTRDGATSPVVTGTLRRDDGGPARFLASLAAVHVHGVTVDWAAVLPSGRRVELPTYAFQRDWYWPLPAPAPAAAAPAGLGELGHPLLAAVADLPATGGLVLTGRLSVPAQPWLADHAVADMVLLPATAFVEVAMQAAGAAGCGWIEDLTLEAPLVLPPDEPIRIQVTVDGPDASGGRTMTVHSRPENAAAPAPWTRHASGLLAPPGSPVPGPAGPDEESAWPPPGAVPVTLDGFYRRPATSGYGPAFHGLREAWRYGDDLLAEVELPAEVATQAGAFALHPALLDAALQVASLADPAGDDTDPGAARMPFAFAGISLRAPGASALRVRLRRAAGGALSVVTADQAGHPVFSVESLVSRPVTPAQLKAAQLTAGPLTAPADATPALLAVEWVPVATAVPAGAVPAGAAAAGTGGPVLELVAAGTAGSGAEAARAEVGRVLGLVQEWLAGEQPAGARLAVVTRGAVAVRPGEGVADLAGAAVWGLVRSAQSEDPGRLVLLDLSAGAETGADGDALENAVLAAVLGSHEPELAIRNGQAYARRLVRLAPAPPAPDPAPEPEPEPRPAPASPGGTVLVTGGTGTLGGLVAGHLAATGRARALTLASRSGPAAPGAPGLAAALARAGAAVQVTACDVADRPALAGLLARIPGDAPLTAVVHTAGVLDDGVTGSLTPERVAAVMRTKADAAWHLHELTAGLKLDAFVLFSSVAAVLGGTGQGSYAAANAFLDGLAARRRAQGLPGISLAWGAWVHRAGIGRDLAPGQLARISRSGITELSAREGLALLDLALARDDALIIPARLDLAGLRARTAQGGGLPPLWHRLIPPSGVPARPAGPDGTDRTGGRDGQAGTLRRRLAALTGTDRSKLLLGLVREHVAAVLGHASPEVIEPGRAFGEIGFDSLTAVELRNRLHDATGLRLPATLVFDYPTPVALAARLHAELGGERDQGPAAPAVTVAAGDPVAIIAMGCRFPGEVAAPEELWDLLARGGDAISEFPRDRGWDAEELFDPDADRAGTSYVRAGGFVHDAGEFDAGFFGISPREALAMDPQQRLLLEVCWEVIERAGIEPGTLRGSATGVFAGAAGSGYGADPRDASGSEGYLVTGSATAVISGRVAYALGLEGPAVTVDTACSSSLVALHLAGQALRAGECDLALAGGVTVMVTPTGFTEFSRQRGLAQDGRCKAFGAAADGMGLSEGAGVVLLERLSDARRHGHPVLAVIRGSAVNSDGASNGLTAPNGPSQQRVIRAALASAGLRPGEIDAVEGHGTGTTLGDPIEAQALLATYGPDRDRPLWLGSVKSNIGHTQAAAGMAGLIKMVLALRHQVLPATLHANEPSPHIDWSAGDVRLLTEPVPWAPNGHPRRAAVSSFGISGTNVHTVLEEAPPGDREPPPGVGAAGPPLAGGQGPAPLLACGQVAWLVSGRTPEGLAAQAARLARWVTGRPALDPAGVAWTLATARTAFEHRAVVTGADRGELTAGLAALAAGEPAAGVVTGAAPAGGGGKVAFVFPGQGGQWAQMGRDLAASCPVFAARLAECGRALAPHTGWDLDDVLTRTELPDRADVVQPALWAVMVSLAAVWQAAGVTPDAVVGHSQGEIAAATVAGILSLDDAAKVVARRSQALAALSGRGGMVSVAEPADAVRDRIAAWPGRLSVAAVNGPAATVVSGEPRALAELAAACDAAGIRARRLPVDYASHGAQVEPLRDEVLTALAGITPGPARIPMISAMTGQWLEGPEAGAAYWYESLRATVEFEQAIRALIQAGHRMFAEVSPHPVLVPAITGTPAGPAPVTVTGTLRRGDGGPGRFLASLAAVHGHGTAVDWAAVLPAAGRVELPTYAFRRQRFWLEPAGTADGRDGAEPEADERFWAAVEGADVRALAEAMGADAPVPSLGEVLPVLASWRRRERERAVIRGWRYRVDWVPVPPSARDEAALAGRWLVLVPPVPAAGELAPACAQAMARSGADVTVAETAPDDSERAALTALLHRVAPPDGGGGLSGISGVVSLLGLDETAVTGCAGVTRGLAGTAALLQALEAAGAGGRLWALTRGAVAPRPGEVLASPAQAMVWGLGLVAALEHPQRWGGLIDLPVTWDDQAGARLCRVLAGGGEDQLAVRPAGVLARRLVRAAPPRDDGRWTPGGTVLVTGGTGAIGRRVARWAAGRGAPRLALASRSGPAAAGVAELAAALAGQGSGAEIVACDAGRRAELAGLLARIGTDGPPLAAVMHAAGAGQEAAGVGQLTAAGLAPAAAKAAAAAHLDELTADLDLGQFVLFSSAAATWGSGGQGRYAAANAFLDALARRRRERGRPAVSVAWGLWGGGGMGDGEGGAQLRRRGLGVMAPDLALAALGQIVDGGETQVTVADVDWERFSPAFTMRRPSPLIASLPEVRQALAASVAAAAAVPDAPVALVRRLAGLPAAEQARILTGIIRAEAAAVLGHASAQAIPADQAFSDLGFDSLTAVELRDRLTAATGLALPATLAFDYPTAAVLAGYLAAELAAGGTDRLPVMAELDRLESALSERPGHGQEKSRITARLEALVRALRDDDAGGRELEAATDDQMFDLAEKELGISDFY